MDIREKIQVIGTFFQKADKMMADNAEYRWMLEVGGAAGRNVDQTKSKLAQYLSEADLAKQAVLDITGRSTEEEARADFQNLLTAFNRYSELLEVLADMKFTISVIEDSDTQEFAEVDVDQKKEDLKSYERQLESARQRVDELADSFDVPAVNLDISEER